MEIQVFVATWLDALVNLLPVSYAFGAGMVSTVNPCGFAMLPAYLGMFLGTGEAGFHERPPWRRGLQAGWVALAMGAGFVVLFGLIGLIISLGGRLVLGLMPWAGLLVGVALLALGVWLLLGRHIPAGVFQRLAARIGDPRDVSTRGFFLFGIAFGAASLSCTLPIFLTVVGSAFAGGGLASSLASFVSYALGMGLVVLALTLSAALFKEGLLTRRIRALMPHLHTVAAVLLVLAGGYIVYYWLILGGLWERLA